MEFYLGALKWMVIMGLITRYEVLLSPAWFPRMAIITANVGGSLRELGAIFIIWVALRLL